MKRPVPRFRRPNLDEQQVLDHLEPGEHAQVAIAPDPAAGSGHVTYHSSGTLTVPYASYAMHLVTYFVRFADVIVTVEGWMVHAAYCLGKRYRIGAAQEAAAAAARPRSNSTAPATPPRRAPPPVSKYPCA